MRKLAGLRVTNGFTQADVARKIGVTQGAVSSWERGDGKPTFDKIPLLAKLYGVTEQDIITACITASPNNIIPQEGASENAIAIYSTVCLQQVYTMSELSEPAISTILGVGVLKVLENIFEHNEGVVFGRSRKAETEKAIEETEEESV